MDQMVRIAALSVTAVVCACVLRRSVPELSLVLILAAGTGILLLAAQGLEQVALTILRLAQLARVEEGVLTAVVKTAALSVLTKITGEICRGAGEGGLAAFVETAGTVLALGVALPLAEGVLELMGQLLQ